MSPIMTERIAEEAEPPALDEEDLFDLKVCALVMADPAGEIFSTSDGCSSTCRGLRERRRLTGASALTATGADTWFPARRQPLGPDRDGGVHGFS